MVYVVEVEGQQPDSVWMGEDLATLRAKELPAAAVLRYQVDVKDGLR